MVKTNRDQDIGHDPSWRPISSKMTAHIPREQIGCIYYAHRKRRNDGNDDKGPEFLAVNLKTPVENFAQSHGPKSRVHAVSPGCEVSVSTVWMLRGAAGSQGAATGAGAAGGVNPACSIIHSMSKPSCRMRWS